MSLISVYCKNLVSDKEKITIESYFWSPCICQIAKELPPPFFFAVCYGFERKYNVCFLKIQAVSVFILQEKIAQDNN